MKCALYKMYDDVDRLLYVGISDSPMRRFNQHSDKPWAGDIRKISLQWMSSRSEAESEEKRAIKNEWPAYNTVHSVCCGLTHDGEPRGPTCDTYIKYRGTKDEWQRIKDAAKASGVDASKLMRDAVMNRVKRIERKGEAE